MILMAGLILAFIDVNLFRFDILPDFIGYSLIAVATHTLAQYTATFQRARNVALPLSVLSLLTYLVSLGVAQLLLLAEAILTILLVWFLLGALMQFADDRGRPDLAGHALNYRRIYVGIAGFAFLIQLAAYAQPDAAEGFVALMGVAILVILVLILRLIYVVRQDLAINPGII